MALYAYVGNDPMNKIDPFGTDVIVVINENNSIEITLPITFSGDAANQTNISAAISNIERTWTETFGGFKVTTKVVIGTSSLDTSVRNTMEIRSDNTDRQASNGSNGHSFVRGGKDAQVTMKDVRGTAITQPNGDQTVGDKNANTYAHEGGHLMGAPDVAHGGIMGPGSGATPTGDDIREIMKGSSTTGGVNTIIDRRKPGL